MLKQKWLAQKDRIEAAPRHVRGISPALIDFSKECPSEANAALAADRAAKAETVEPPPPPPPPAPAGPVARAKTPGYFVDWEKAISARCDTDTPDGRTRCAQMKIDRAVAENRLSQAEVDACRPSVSQGRASRNPERAQSQRGLQDRRTAGLGGDAFWKWSNSGGCSLVELVQQTFAAVAPPAPAAQPLGPGENDLRMCEINKRHPDCQAAMAITPESYRTWDRKAYSACARTSTPGQARDACARTVLEQAVGSKRLRSTVIDACRAEWARGPKAEIEYLEVHQCVNRRAHLDEARTSVVLQANTKPADPRLPRDGYRRPNELGAIYARDWAHVAQRSDDGDYFLNFLGKFEGACPSLGLDETQFTLAQLHAQGVRDALGRVANRQGTQRDLGTLLYAANEMLKSMQDCEAHIQDDFRYEACLAEKESSFKLPPSKDARHDVGVLVKRHGCDSAETRRFAKSFSAWLLLPERKRSVMAWSLGDAKAAEYDAMFENCSHQAGGDAAYAWCGCYVRKYSQTGPGSRAAPAEVAAAGKATAFVGDENSWFVPHDLSDCAPLRQEITSWREERVSNKNVTACLIGERAVPPTTASELQACRYRTAWGQIEVTLPKCTPRLFAYQWGDESTTCE